MAAAERFVVVAEAAKRGERLGSTRDIPVEVVRFGWRETRRRVLELLDTADLREREDGEPYITDQGHYILECAPAPRAISARPSPQSRPSPTWRCSAARTAA